MSNDSNVFSKVSTEVLRAKNLFPKFNSAHEGYGILLEEVDELWDAIKLNQKTPGRDEQIRKEAIQVAAMACRLLIDICGESPT